MKNWHSITLCVLILGMFLSFLLETLFVQTLFLWMLGAFAIYTFIRTRKIYFQWYSVFFAAMFLLRVWALWRQPELKFSDIELSISFALFPLIFTFVKVEKEQWKIIQKGVVFGFAVFLSILLLRYIVNVCAAGMFLDSLKFAKSYYGQFMKTPFYDHPSFLAVILASGIPMCFNLAAQARKHWHQWLWLAFIPLLVFMVFVSGSRTGLFICGALILLSSIYSFKKMNLLTKLFLGMGVLAAVGIFSRTEINYIDDPIREEMNRFVSEKIKEKPLWGYGYGTQLAQIEQAGDISKDYPVLTNVPDDTRRRFHNVYLEEIFQFGVIGALPLFLLLLDLLYLAIKKRDLFLLSFLLTYMLLFYTDVPDAKAKGIMPMMLLVALIMNVQNAQNKPVEHES